MFLHFYILFKIICCFLALSNLDAATYQVGCYIFYMFLSVLEPWVGVGDNGNFPRKIDSCQICYVDWDLDNFYSAGIFQQSIPLKIGLVNRQIIGGGGGGGGVRGSPGHFETPLSTVIRNNCSKTHDPKHGYLASISCSPTTSGASVLQALAGLSPMCCTLRPLCIHSKIYGHLLVCPPSHL